MKRQTIGNVAGAFNPKAASMALFHEYIFRPISFVMTLALLRLGVVNPNKVTYSNFFIGMAAVIFIAIGTDNLFYAGLFFYFLFVSMDFVDGNIARIKDKATYFGKFIDGSLDALIESILIFSLGCHLFFSGHGLILLFVSIAACFISAFSFYIIDRLAFFNRWIKLDNKDKGGAGVNPFETTVFPVKRFGNIITDFKFVTLFSMFFFKARVTAIVLFTGASFSWSAVLILTSLYNARLNLNVHRISKWDARKTEDK